MASESRAPVVTLYPVLDGFIGHLNLSDEACASLHNTSTAQQSASGGDVQTIVLLDRSGSMGRHAARMAHTVLPAFLRRMVEREQRSKKKQQEAKLTLITFDSTAAMLQATAAGLAANNSIQARGGTEMHCALDMLDKYVRTTLPEYIADAKHASVKKAAQFGANDLPAGLTPIQRHLRVLAISDGDLNDMDATVASAAKLATTLAHRFTVNAQAVRLFTSSCQPDTRGLSSVLQLNTLVPAQLLDIMAQASDDFIVNELLKLFHADGLDQPVTLSCPPNATFIDENHAAASASSDVSTHILQSAPWVAAQSSLSVVRGENTVWLKRAPSFLLLNGKQRVQVRLADGRFNEETYGRVLGAKSSYFLQQLRVLKVLGSEESAAQLQRVTSYFDALEQFVAAQQAIMLREAGGDVAESDGRDGRSMHARIQHFRSALSKKKSSVAQRMREIANDSKVSELNSAQSAEYLRNVSSSSKAIARRAGVAGLEFDVVVQRELAALAANIGELDDINDDAHMRSFYSQDTTLGGVRALASLVNAERSQLETMSVSDVLPLLNMVGVACSGPIGDFPDPMTWRVRKLFPASPLSLSDVLQAHMASGGAKLRPVGVAAPDDPDAPGAGTISNVVPIFDDQRVHRFLRRHAPSLLEYTASVGMRRVVAGVPMTHACTLAAGVWQMVFELNSVGGRTAQMVDMWLRLVQTYSVAIGNYFAHVLPHVRAPVPVSGASFYLANNGITNMLSPLLTWLTESGCGAGADLPANMPAILRALYTFEVRLAVKRYVRKLVPADQRDKTDQYGERLLESLLGIDGAKYRAELPPMFCDAETAAKLPRFHDELHVNEGELANIVHEFWYVDHVCLLPPFLRAALMDNPAQAVAAVPMLSDEFVHSALGLPADISMRDFRLLNIAQALQNPTKASRVDTEHQKMLIPDLGGPVHARNAIKDLRSIVSKHYAALFTSDMAARTKAERVLLISELVSSLACAKTLGVFSGLWRKGVSRGRHEKVQIHSASAQGFVELKNALLDPALHVPQRLDKIYIMLLGRNRRAIGKTHSSSASSSSSSSPSSSSASSSSRSSPASGVKVKTKGDKRKAAALSVEPDAELDATLGPIVWNGGKSLFVADMTPFDAVFGADDPQWLEVKTLHRSTYHHQYRTVAPNHRGHSNSKPSYFARGFATLESFRAGVSPAEWAAYQKLHTACCGLSSALGLKQRRTKRRQMLETDLANGVHDANS